jgi:hypothetical protein
MNFPLEIFSSIADPAERELIRVAKSQFVPGRCGCQKSSASSKSLLKRPTPSITLAWCTILAVNPESFNAHPEFLIVNVESIILKPEVFTFEPEILSSIANPASFS